MPPHQGSEPADGEIKVHLAARLRLIRRARHVRLELVEAALFRHAVDSPRELLQAPQSTGIGNEDVHAAETPRAWPQAEAPRSQCPHQRHNVNKDACISRDERPETIVTRGPSGRRRLGRLPPRFLSRPRRRRPGARAPAPGAGGRGEAAGGDRFEPARGMRSPARAGPAVEGHGRTVLVASAHA